MPPPAKIYLVVNHLLSPGQQAVQAAHALQEFNVHEPKLVRDWYQSSNTLALLSASPEELGQLLDDARRTVAARPFHEPDLNNQLTALALGPEARRLVRRFPLALR